MLAALLAALLLSPASAADVASMFPPASPTAVAVFRDLAGKIGGQTPDFTVPGGLGRFAELDFQGPGAGLVLGSLDLSPEALEEVAAAAKAVETGAPDAGERLRRLDESLKQARLAAYARADETGARLAEEENIGAPGERDAALEALSRFYGRGLQLSRIELLRRRRGLELDGRPHLDFQGPREAVERASDRATAAFSVLASNLDAETLRRHPRLRPFARLAGEPAAPAALGALKLSAAAVERVGLAAAALRNGDASALPALEAELHQARRDSYGEADRRAGALAAAPLHDAGGAPAADLQERADTLRALSSLYGRGLQLSHIKLTRRLLPPRAAAAPVPAAAAEPPIPNAASVLPAAPGAKFLSGPELQGWQLAVMVFALLVAAAFSYHALFSAFGEVFRLWEQDLLSAPLDWP